MIASAQFTIISLCDVVTSDTPPENPYEGQLWVDTSVTPPETKIWDGNEWVVQNDIETIRTTISILTEKDAQFQQTIDGLNSYVATLTETVETVSNDQGVLEERILNSESRVSELEHTVDGLSVTIYCYCRDASIYLADIMISEGAIPRKWTPAPNEIYTQEVKIDKRGIEVSNSASSQRTVITNTEFAGYYNDEVIFTLNKDETQTKKTTVDGELTVGKTKFVPMPTASEGLNIVILD